MREKQAQIAYELQKMLGEDYTVRFDDCDSGLTRVYYKPLHKLIKEVPNESMTKGLSLSDYTASREDLLHAYALRSMS